MKSTANPFTHQQRKPVAKNPVRTRQARIVKAMIDRLQKLEFTQDAARRSAKVRFDVSRQPLPYADSLLAGRALAAT